MSASAKLDACVTLWQPEPARSARWQVVMRVSGSDVVHVHTFTADDFDEAQRIARRFVRAPRARFTQVAAHAWRTVTKA